MKLRNLVTVITGASSGIGWETALEFGRRGAVVVAVARRKERLKQLCRLIESNGGRCHPIRGDLTNPNHIARLFGQLRRTFGRVDILINNAGRGLKMRLTETRDRDFQAVIDTNLTAVYRCTREALKLMGRGSHIITVSSIAGIYGGPMFSAYSASKHGVTGMMRSLRWEMLGTGIKVSWIHPGRVDTEFFRYYGQRPGRWQMLAARDIAVFLAAIASRNPLLILYVKLSNVFKRLYYLLRYSIAK